MWIDEETIGQNDIIHIKLLCIYAIRLNNE